MYALCLESSHERGMGHLFRGINLYQYLRKEKEDTVILINQNEQAIKVLKERQIPYETVNFDDIYSEWESRLIEKYGITVWLNDKYQTRRELYLHVKHNSDVVLAAIDEEGGCDDLLDIHFAGMVFQQDFAAKGKYVFQGIDYIVLNAEIAKYRRLRKEARRLVVSMGGSDTYGVTIKVLQILKKRKLRADIVVGPSFEHMDGLMRNMADGYQVYRNVPSLAEKFSEYDAAITGGGVTCIEAAAAGLPCVIVANEPFEADTAKFMENLGTAVFAGHHTQIDENKFDVAKLDIESMSRAGLRGIALDGARNIYRKLQECRKELETENGR